MDSGAFTELSTHGAYRADVATYAEQARRWTDNGTLDAVVAQDYMCEPFILARTGGTVLTHQQMTIDRYDGLLGHEIGAPVLPVLQGYQPEEYAARLDMYEDRLKLGAWVGVGSVCKRQGSPWAIHAVLSAIKTERPDLRLHGFGVKLTALRHAAVRPLLWSADSMAWSYSARMAGRDGNSWLEAESFRRRVETACGHPGAHQPSLDDEETA